MTVNTGFLRTNRPVNNDLTKLVREHFRAPESKPYCWRKVWTKTKNNMIRERSEDLWEQHYIRRMDNMAKGHHSVPWEPYKPVGNDLALSTKDLVLTTMKECLDDRLNIASLREDGFSRSEKRHVTLPPIGAVSKKVVSTEVPCRDSVTSVDEDETLGYSNVRCHLKEYDQLIRNVRAGQHYEDYIRNRQESQNRQNDNTDIDNEMVLMSLTNLQLGLADVTVMEEPDSEESSDTDLMMAGNFKPRRISVFVNNKKMVLKEDQQLSMESGLNASTIEGINKLMSVKSGAVEKKNRLRKDHLEYLRALVILLNSIHNIKSRDLKSKNALKIDVMRMLRKDPVKQERAHDSHCRTPCRQKGPTSVTKIGSVLDHSPYQNTMAQISEMASKIKRRSIWPGKQKINFEHPPVETWEDLINLETKKGQNFQMQSNIVLKALKWSRRKALIGPAGQTDSRASVTMNTPDSSLNIHPSSNLRIRKELLSSESHRQQFHASAVRKLPIWQMVALDKPMKNEEKRRVTSRSADPDNIVNANRKALDKVKHDLQQDTEMEFQRLDREKMAVFKLKYNAFEGMSPLYEQHLSRIRHPRPTFTSQSVNVTFDVQPSKWYDDLQGKTHSIVGMYDSEVNEVLKKLAKYSTMDNKTIQFSKAKLCLIVMSLPAYEALTIAMQKAIKYVMENILLGEEKQLLEWFKYRKIPYFILEDSACNQISD
ncbi:hypothetical protein FSP39_005161 [Pinctada imbricata]|uniref:Uncharacterized protein n=1 Tax=Pinctada imbricata TaxID=66713 RepID=A0AA89BMY0_PINIB|nr:hypothetical protein FSP39_005161 [Pinctada imbricata]